MKANIVNPKEDLQTIREIMERSSKFVSLSGLSGIFAGVCALIGAAVAWFFIFGGDNISIDDFLQNPAGFHNMHIGYNLAMDGLLVLGFAILGTVYFSFRKARVSGRKLWTNLTLRLLIHVMIPLISGGIIIVVLLFRGIYDLIPSFMLIFYGLSLVNAGKFTFGEIHHLGLTEIVLGLIASIFTAYSLLFWTIGFGLVHILYGMLVYFRHEG